MPAKKCPKCALFSHETALRCDCGYDFTSGAMEESYLKDREQIKQNKGKSFASFLEGGIGLVSSSTQKEGGEQESYKERKNRGTKRFLTPAWYLDCCIL